jgi:microsomal dipeptidase-like Zn-dependent dipeptidase
VIKEMNKWGMTIDVSHPSENYMKDMVTLTRAAIIVSHSSTRALCNRSINLDDKQIRLTKKMVALCKRLLLVYA